MTRHPLENAAHLLRLASAQHGYFTATMARAAGYRDSTHGYHVGAGHWIKPCRGIYRLASVPPPAWGDLIAWSLWSRGRDGLPQGVYGYETARALHEHAIPIAPPYHLIVPRSFRKNCELPDALQLHRADLPPEEVETWPGLRLTTRERTARDLGAPPPPTRRIDAFEAMLAAGED